MAFTLGFRSNGRNTVHIVASSVLRGTGLLLVVAATLKATAFTELSQWMATVGREPEWQVNCFSFSLIVIEIGVGAVAIFQPQLAAAFLLVIFSLFLGVHAATLFGFISESCPCFGTRQFVEQTEINAVEMAVLSGLVVLFSVIILLEGRSS